MNRKYPAAKFGIALGLALLLGAGFARAQEQKPVPDAPRPPAEVPGITPELLVRSNVPGAAGKILMLNRVTYEPGVRRRKHYHTSQVIFYVLQGAMVVQEDTHEPITLNVGDSLLVKPGTVHAHWNASTSAKLIFAEVVLLDEGQQSTVPMEP